MMDWLWSNQTKSRNFPGGTEENYEKPQSGQPMFLAETPNNEHRALPTRQSVRESSSVQHKLFNQINAKTGN
jgi:hypothetical protein